MFLLLIGSLILALSQVSGLYEELFSTYKLRTDIKVQKRAAEDVIKRLLGPNESQLFDVIINEEISDNGMDTFHIFKDGNNDKVVITGSNGLSATWGFHFYLKNYCNCHVSWDGDQLLLPDDLPRVNITKSSIEKFRYYQNVCTYSYSFAWWDWPRWEREIDWMALNGINIALAFTAQEAIWQRVYDGLGLQKTGFTGPAFLAWNRMGNLRNFGGGLPQSWHSKSIFLQHLILSRMRELGIIPVLPAFSGLVPRYFKKVFPDADVVNGSRWISFADDYCCPYLLNPSDPMFPVVSRIFLREYISEFGTDHIYSCDTFNENTPPTNNPEYLSNFSKAVYEGIIQIDPLALWMLQGWMFINPFWGQAQVKAYITSVPIGRMLILDLQSELRPQYEKLESYYGQPFIWCTLHNFGGQLGMYGSLDLINKGIIQGRNFINSTMIGIGITPEGIDQNYIVYQFTLDSALRYTTINITEWVSSYVLQRYNVYNKDLSSAWFILKETVYNYNHNAVNYQLRGSKSIGAIHSHLSRNILTSRPSLSMSEIIWYNKTEIWEVFQKFLKVSILHEISTSELFQHDFIDVTRQTVQLAVGILYRNFMSDYNRNNLKSFQNISQLFVDLLQDLDVILGTGKKFLLGKWLDSAKKLAENSTETLQYEYNARNQITLWGPTGEIRDYAAKQWSGMIAYYYKPRWEIFISALNESLINGTRFDKQAVRRKMFTEVEQPFTFDHSVFPKEPHGNTIKTIKNFYKKWNNILNHLFENDRSFDITV